MDLGLAGRRAIVCGASKGLGLACADSLAREGCEIILTARSADVLEAAAVGLCDRHGVTVTAVAADLTTAAGRERVLAACPAPDILVTNVGAPGTGTFAELDEATWRRAIDACLLMPVLMMRSGRWRALPCCATKAICTHAIRRGSGTGIRPTSRCSPSVTSWATAGRPCSLPTRK